MDRKVKIYCIKNPLDNTIFYVGATIQPKLNKRICYHITESIHDYHVFKGEIVGKPQGIRKIKIIRSIVAAGLRPIGILLEEVEFDKADEKEQFYHDLFTRLGYELAQSFPFGSYRNKVTKLVNNSLKNSTQPQK